MIWLLRHGEAEDGFPDAERKLTAKGERQSRNAGRALATFGVNFDVVLASPKVRAFETARIAAREFDQEPAVEEQLAGGEFDATALAAGLDSVLLVGHEPDLSSAVHDLTGLWVDFKKGGLIAINGSSLRLLLAPAEIAAIADRGAD